MLSPTRNFVRTRFVLRGASTSSYSTKDTEAATLITHTNQCAIITLNRPKVLNAVNNEMIRSLDVNLRNLEKLKSFIIIKGSGGGRSFSVGGDVSTLLKVGVDGSRTFFREVYTLLSFVAKSKIPYISLIDGAVMGGGFALTVYGKYRVATERTIMAMPEIGIGMFPDVGGSYFLNKLHGKLGTYLGMTGGRLKGEDVLRAGLATHFCKSSQLDELESALIKITNSNEIQKTLDGFSLKIPKDEGINLLTDKIKICFNAITVEEILENLEKDGSEWALNTLKILKEKCPLSLKLTLRQMRVGANKPLDECLKMEYRLAFRRLADPDFREGVRALLIDKDNQPKWNPSSLDAVTDDLISTYFEKLAPSEELKL